MAAHALAGLRVLDFTHHVAGPYATKLFADMGATVIKVERPGLGDPARALGPFPADRPDPEASGLFQYLNGNKKSLTLDLRDPAHLTIAHDLAAWADVCIENFRPGVLPRLGLGWDTLHPRNPRLVMCSLSNFGQDGPYRDYRAWDLVASALGGFLHLTGDAARPPLANGGHLPQFQGGMYAAVGILSALLARDLTGLGQYVDVSIFEAVVSFLERADIIYTHLGQEWKRTRRHEMTHPFTLLPAGDGTCTLAVGTPQQWEMLATLLGKPEWAQDDAFTSDRLAHADEIDATLVPWLQARTRAEITEATQALRIPGGPVLEPTEILDHPLYRERAFFHAVPTARGDRLRVPGPPFRMQRTPLTPGPAPRLGQHTREVIVDILGHPPADLRALRLDRSP